MIFAVCSRCNSRTRLTKKLALELAAQPGPPVSVCCNEDITESVDGQTVASAQEAPK